MIAIKKILVPTDLSDDSVPAIGYAISLARDHGAEVVILHTVPAKMLKPSAGAYLSGGVASEGMGSVALPGQPNVEGLLESRKRVVGNFLEQRIAPELLRATQITPLVRLGKVVDEILAAAKETQADVIVMISQASPLRRFLGGSFTERTIRKARCPVLTIVPSAEIRTDKDERVPLRSINRWAA